MSNEQHKRGQGPYPISTGTPPKNSLRVAGWHSLPLKTRSARYRITKSNGTTHIISVKNHARQVLDGLIVTPVFCASIARVSHFVNILRKEKRVGIHTEPYENDRETSRARFGVFFLTDKVELIEGNSK